MRIPCCFKGCRRFVVKGEKYCSDHNSPKRDSDKRYGSSRWKRLRVEKLKLNPICERCGAVAKIVHHIEEVKDGGEFWVIENLESLCRDCHEKEHGNRFNGKKIDLEKWKEFLNEE